MDFYGDDESGNGQVKTAEQFKQEKGSYSEQKERQKRVERMEELKQDVLLDEKKYSVEDIKNGVKEYKKEIRSAGKTGNSIIDSGLDIAYTLGIIKPEDMARLNEKKLEQLSKQYEGNIRKMKRDRDRNIEDLSIVERKYDQAFEFRELTKAEVNDMGAELIQLNELYKSVLSGNNGHEIARTTAEIREDFYKKKKKLEEYKEDKTSTEFEINRLTGKIDAKKETIMYLDALVTSAQVSRMEKIENMRITTIDDIGNSDYPISIAVINEKADKYTEKHLKDINTIRSARTGLYETLSGILTGITKRNGKFSGNGSLDKLTKEAGKYRDRLSDKTEEIYEMRKNESLI